MWIILRERKATEWENTFAKYISHKKLVNRMCKKLSRFNNKNTSNNKQFEQTFHQRNRDGKQTHERMLHITSY